MRLVDGFIPIFERLTALPQRLAESDSMELETVRNEFIDQLAVLDSEPYLEHFTEQQLEAARFAVVALIDEKVGETDWGSRHEWSTQPLQKQLFSTRNAGEVFFDKLDNLEQLGDGSDQVRLVYLYCLKLGFSGRFFAPGERGFLETLIDQQYRLLMPSSVSSNGLFHGRISEAPDSSQPKQPVFSTDTVIWIGVVVVVASYLWMRSDYFQLISALTALLD